MALAPRLELKQGQTLVMTPQLQQAIKLLQLSNIDLAAYVEEQLEKNPLLERDDKADGAPSDAGAEAGENAGAGEGADQELAISAEAPTSEAAEGAIDADYESLNAEASRADLQNEQGEGDRSLADWTTVGSGRPLGGDDMDFDANLTADLTLADHLTAQLHIAARDEKQRLIGANIIDLIDEAGYVRGDAVNVADRLGADLSDVEATLRLIQGFDPVGVGARDLKECLRLQLKDLDRLDPAMDAFVENLELLAKHDFAGLKKATGADQEDLVEMIEEIKALNPKPGLAFGAQVVQPVIPDVFVRPGPDGAWKVELNSDTLPRVLVNAQYYAEVSAAGRSESDKTYLSECLNNANWLVKSLDQRARTILKVASEIVRQQDAFLVKGVEYLRPLNLRTVAEAIDMHESTVSRVTANKYIATPRGVFELKYFFTSAIAAAGGGEAHSAEAVRHRIRKLIDDEPPTGVLSDDRIVEILRADDIDIARRTVAKYREAMGIPSSVQRRRMKKQSA
ncbi:MAG: RNA polymerase factor sigma-54 [Pseudomonadota bacterium]